MLKEKLKLPKGSVQETLSLDIENQNEFEKKLDMYKKERLRKDGMVPGVIVLRHIPHGFYEKEMKQYFSQFGKVTRLRLARSKKTGGSRNFAFIEFECDEVAKIAADTMNNYLMFGKLMKCDFVPPEKVHPNCFRGWRKGNLLGYERYRKEQNKPKSEEAVKEKWLKRLKKLETSKKKMAELGINFTFTVKLPELIVKNNSSENENVVSLSQKSSEKKLANTAKRQLSEKSLRGQRDSSDDQLHESHSQKQQLKKKLPKKEKDDVMHTRKLSGVRRNPSDGESGDLTYSQKQQRAKHLHKAKKSPKNESSPHIPLVTLCRENVTTNEDPESTVPSKKPRVKRSSSEKVSASYSEEITVVAKAENAVSKKRHSENQKKNANAGLSSNQSFLQLNKQNDNDISERQNFTKSKICIDSSSKKKRKSFSDFQADCNLGFEQKTAKRKGTSLLMPNETSMPTGDDLEASQPSLFKHTPRHLARGKTSTPRTSPAYIMEIDPSEEEITFKTPPNTVRVVKGAKPLNVGKSKRSRSSSGQWKISEK